MTSFLIYMIYARLLPLTWSSSGFECAQKGAMVHLIFPSGSISMSHHERTTWARPDARGSNFLLWQAAELLTCLLKSTLWKNIQELKQTFKAYTLHLHAFMVTLPAIRLICNRLLPSEGGDIRFPSHSKRTSKDPFLSNVLKSHHPGWLPGTWA